MAIDVTIRHVVLYESAADVHAKAPAHFGAHWARAIFASREGAEEFIAGDPFVLEGVVRSWQIREWSEALGQLAAA